MTLRTFFQDIIRPQKGRSRRLLLFQRATDDIWRRQRSAFGYRPGSIHILNGWWGESLVDVRYEPMSSDSPYINLHLLVSSVGGFGRALSSIKSVWCVHLYCKDHLASILLPLNQCKMQFRGRAAFRIAAVPVVSILDFEDLLHQDLLENK